MNGFFDYVKNNTDQIGDLLLEHLQLTVFAVVIAVVLGIPIGILITRYQKFAKPVLALTSVVQAVPSLALLGFLIPFIGIGSTPAIIMVVLYSQLSDPTALLWAGALMGLFVNGMMGGYGAVMSEAYPTEARATAQNVLFNIGRAVGGLGPVVIGALAMSYSFQVAIALLAAIYVLDMLATAFLIPELKGRELS